MATKKTKGATTASGEAFDVEAARAKAVATYSNFIEQVDNTERMGIGTWIGMPHKMKDWHFVRFNKSIDTHRELAYLMKEKGYIDAPPGTKCVGFERDGERALYLCCPPELWKALRARRAQAQVARAQTLRESFGGHIPEGADIRHKKVGA